MVKTGVQQSDNYKFLIELLFTQSVWNFDIHRPTLTGLKVPNHQTHVSSPILGIHSKNYYW